jgi:hypothetical protein
MMPHPRLLHAWTWWSLDPCFVEMSYPPKIGQ